MIIDTPLVETPNLSILSAVLVNFAFCLLGLIFGGDAAIFGGGPFSGLEKGVSDPAVDFDDLEDELKKLLF